MDQLIFIFIRHGNGILCLRIIIVYWQIKKILIIKLIVLKYSKPHYIEGFKRLFLLKNKEAL